MSNRYISKPEIIEAIQYDGTNIKELKKLKGSTSISVHNNIPYLRMYNKQGELSYLEGIGKGDWLVRYEDGETLELFTDDEFKECFLKMSEKHLDHATGWLSDFIKQREIDINNTISNHLNIGGRWAEPNSTFEDNVQKLKEQREVNKRIQNYFDNSKTVHERLDEKIKQYSEFKFSKFLQSLKQLIKEVEDDTSK
jgi:hypothetical protein